MICSQSSYHQIPVREITLISALSVSTFLCAKILSTNIFNADMMRAARNRQMEMSLRHMIKVNGCGINRNLTE